MHLVQAMPCPMHTNHFFHPLCKLYSVERKIAIIALHILTLGIPLAVYHIYNILSSQLCKRLAVETHPPISLPKSSPFHPEFTSPNVNKDKLRTQSNPVEEQKPTAQESSVRQAEALNEIDPQKEAEFEHNLRAWRDAKEKVSPLEKRQEAYAVMLKAFRENATVLNLKNLKLTSIPPCIGDLQALTTLQLSNNRLIKVPNEIVNLKNLKDFQLQRNDFYQFPFALIEMRSGCKINLIGNRIGAEQISAIRSRLVQEVSGPERSQLFVTAAENGDIVEAGESLNDLISYWLERFSEAFPDKVLNKESENALYSVLGSHPQKEDLKNFLIKIDEGLFSKGMGFKENVLKEWCLRDSVLIQVYYMLELASKNKAFCEILFDKAQKANADCHDALPRYIRELEIAYLCHVKNYTDAELANFVIGVARLEMLEAAVNQDSDSEARAVYNIAAMRLELSPALAIPLSSEGLKVVDSSSVREYIPQHADRMKQDILNASTRKEDQLTLLLNSEIWRNRVIKNHQNRMNCMDEVFDSIRFGSDPFQDEDDAPADIKLKKSLFSQDEIEVLKQKFIDFNLKKNSATKEEAKQLETAFNAEIEEAKRNKRNPFIRQATEHFPNNGNC